MFIDLTSEEIAEMGVKIGPVKKMLSILSSLKNTPKKAVTQETEEFEPLGSTTTITAPEQDVEENNNDDLSVTTILKTSDVGRSILHNYEESGCIDTETRRHIVRLCCDYLINLPN